MIESNLELGLPLPFNLITSWFGGMTSSFVTVNFWPITGVIGQIKEGAETMSAPTGVCPQTHTAITFTLYFIVRKS